MKKTAYSGSAISAAEWNRIANKVDRLGALTAQYPLELSNVGANPMLRIIDPEIRAVLLSPSSSSSSSSCTPGNNPYSWQEVQPTGDGRWSILARGRSGSTRTNPAYEANGTCMDPGTIVKLRPGLNGEYIFDYCCGSNAPLVLSSSSESSSSVSESSLSGSSTSQESSSQESSTSSEESSSEESSGSSESESSTSCECDGLLIDVVVDVACVGGSLQVTRQTICIPGGYEC